MKALECSQHYTSLFSDAQWQITPKSVVVSGRNFKLFKLLCMSSLPARMKMIQSKMKELEWSQHFPIINIWGFFQKLKDSSLRSPLSDVAKISNSFTTLWLSLLPAKIKKIRSKNEGARVFTKLYINLSDAQGQMTPESVVVSGRNFKPSKLLCMSFLPERMNMIQSTMKELEWS